MADNNFNSVDVVKWKVTAGWVEKDGQKFGQAPEVRTQELERRAYEKATKVLKRKKKRKLEKDEVSKRMTTSGWRKGGVSGRRLHVTRVELI